MSGPWIDGDGTIAGSMTAVAIGVGFGAALERAGLGSARKLVGQFYLVDLTVFKVMFSAIVVAMLGSFWLGWLGVVDLSRVFVPGTWLLPQLVGGLVFGAGMVLAGLCPGTSCVAAASGRGDGLAVLLGMFTGVLGIGLSIAPLADLHASTPRGPLTLPAWLHLPYGAVVLAVVVMALVGFRLADRLTDRHADRPADRHPRAS